MKKVFMSAAVVAMMVAAVACECNNSKKAEAPAEEAVEAVEEAEAPAEECAEECVEAAEAAPAEAE